MAWRFSMRHLVGLVALYLLPATLAAQELAQPGADARIVVFDASGSMVARNFNSNTATRMEIAQELLIEVYRELLERGDTIPTATLVFGAGFVWEDEKRRNGWSGTNDPATLTHPICKDSRVRLPSSTVSGQRVEDAQTLAGALSPRGMTPIHRSLLEGLRAFRGDIEDKTLQFVLISDMFEPNCLPEGVGLCETLLPEISRINAAGGSVSTIVFETPSSTALETFAECLSVVRIPIPQENPDIPEIVEDAFNLLTVTPLFIAGGANNHDPDGVDPGKSHLRFTENGKRVPLASGPYGAFDVPRGEYMLTGTIDDATFAETATISTSGHVRIQVPPGTLIISTEDGVETLLDEVIISRPSGQPVASLRNYKTGTPLNLANGPYNVVARLANGTEVSGSVPLRLGSTRELTLNFANAASQQVSTARDVDIDVRLSGPTLDVDGEWPPAVTLVGPGATGGRMPLSSSGFAGQLAFGSYVIEIDAEVPHQLGFDVVEGDGPMSVEVTIPAGWVTALSPTGASGNFELRDSQGDPILRMYGERIQHALPEGAYSLVFLSSDGRHIERPFHIRLGRETLIDDF